MLGGFVTAISLVPCLMLELALERPALLEVRVCPYNGLCDLQTHTSRPQRIALQL